MNAAADTGPAHGADRSGVSDRARSGGLGSPGDWTELVPLLRRCRDLDAAAVVRVRRAGERLSVFAWLPFEVLVGRTVAVDEAEPFDAAASAAELLAWVDGERQAAPADRSLEWRRGLPPPGGWTRLDRVPDTVVRDLVRTGALALKQAAAREGVPGASPRSATADALLDSVVLTVSDDTGHRAELDLRMLSAATRMGFVPRGSELGVDVSGGWVRLAAGYGSVFAAPRGLQLQPAPRGG